MGGHSELTLLMVDDNTDDIFLTRKLVRKEGIVNNFISERNPERVIEVLQELSKMGVDENRIMILLDIKMPRLDGFEVLKKIRENEKFKDLPVIMLSSSDDEADMFEALELGASGYVVKPFRGDEFFAALSNVKQVKHQLVQ
ncbi:MAG: response regulator [Xanthobacteraceae bacterium]